MTIVTVTFNNPKHWTSTLEPLHTAHIPRPQSRIIFVFYSLSQLPMSHSRQGHDGLLGWVAPVLVPCPCAHPCPAQFANAHVTETVRAAIKTAALNLLPAACGFISAPPPWAAGGCRGDGQIKSSVSDKPSCLLQSGASASRFPQSPARPPPEECAASLAWQTFKGAHKGPVMKTLWKQESFICNQDCTFQEQELGDRMHACEHTRLIINSCHLLLLKKYCRG